MQMRTVVVPVRLEWPAQRADRGWEVLYEIEVRAKEIKRGRTLRVTIDRSERLHDRMVTLIEGSVEIGRWWGR